MLTHLKCMVKNIFLFFLVSLSGITLSYAYCDNNTYSGPYPHSIDFGTITASPTLAVGDVIASQQVSESGVKVGGCWAGTIPFTGEFLDAYSTPSAVGGPVYNTNLPGVGIKAHVNPTTIYINTTTGNACNTGEFYFGSNTSCYDPADFGLYDRMDVMFSLVKTGNITPGSLTKGSMSIVMADGVPLATYAVTGGTITVPTCSVVTPSSNVMLGNHLTTDFTGAGSVTASQNVQVQLNCPESGMKVFATLNATQDTSTAQSGAIKLTPSSGLTAGGVAVQMLDNNNNGIPLNSQIQYMTTTQGTFDFGWKARYLQTGSAVTAGDANAYATISLTYQ